MAGDWIKLHRSLLDSEQMTDDWLCRLFIWCLLRANFEASMFRGQSILPGQFITGRISAAAELHVSPSKWYRGIQRLELMGCIAVEANSNWTTITICKWKTYQLTAEKSEQPADSQRTAGDTTSGQPADTIKEGKNAKKGRMEEVIPPNPQGGFADTGDRKAKRGMVTQFVRPTLDDVAAYCRERLNSVDPQQWMDHYTANGWMVGRNPMRDWRAAVRQWEKSNFTRPVVGRSSRAEGPGFFDGIKEFMEGDQS